MKLVRLGIGIVVLVLSIGYWGFLKYWYWYWALQNQRYWYWYCSNDFWVLVLRLKFMVLSVSATKWRGTPKIKLCPTVCCRSWAPAGASCLLLTFWMTRCWTACPERSSYVQICYCQLPWRSFCPASPLPRQTSGGFRFRRGEGVGEPPADRCCPQPPSVGSLLSWTTCGGESREKIINFGLAYIRVGLMDF